MQRRIIKKCIENRFPGLDRIRVVKGSVVTVLNVVMKWYVAYGTIYTNYKILCLDVDMGCQRQAMRNLRLGSLTLVDGCIFRLTDTICILGDCDKF
jgi:hypothetical protein